MSEMPTLTKRLYQQRPPKRVRTRTVARGRSRYSTKNLIGNLP
jgi:hypothetical protein